MVTKLKNVENVKETLFDLEYGEKHTKTRKMQNAHCRTWNMARILKIMGNETQKLSELEYGEKQ
jgi:hypothetical protein